jgi:hypothetical protein
MAHMYICARGHAVHVDSATDALNACMHAAGRCDANYCMLLCAAYCTSHLPTTGAQAEGQKAIALHSCLSWAADTAGTARAGSVSSAVPWMKLRMSMALLQLMVAAMFASAVAMSAMSRFCAAGSRPTMAAVKACTAALHMHLQAHVSNELLWP